MELTLEKVREVLAEVRDKELKPALEKLNASTDANAKDVAGLSERLGEIDKAIADVNKNIEEKKSFGLPGYEAKEKGQWSWQKFFFAQYLIAANGKSANVQHTMGPSEVWDKYAPFEAEASRAYMQRRDKDFDAASQALGGARRDFNATDGSSGGFLVPPAQYAGDIVETIYANTPIMNFPGVVKLTGLSGDLAIPKDLGNLTAYWVGETTKPTKTDSSVGLEFLRPKKMGVFTKVSNRLLSSGAGVDAWIKEKMSRDGAVKMSEGLISGTGSDYQPKGFTQYKTSMTSGGSAGTNGARFSTDDAMKLQQVLAAANEKRDSGSYAYLMNPTVLYGLLRERVLQYSGQTLKNAQPVLAGGLFTDQDALQKALRASFGTTTQILGTETAGTSSTTATTYFGDWSRFVVATFRDPIFRVSDVAGDGSTGSAFLDDQLYMVMFLEMDCAVTRPSAFSYMTGCEVTDTSWSA